MSVLPIRLYPDPVLTNISKPITQWGSELTSCAHHLTQTFDVQPGGLGIAAPQIGYSQRVILIDVTRRQKAHGRLILINPEIVNQTGETIFREGCMSLPDFTANVRRSEKVSVKAYNEAGQMVTFDFEGLEAIVLQHEIDHLNGKLFIHRVANLQTDVFRRKRYLK